MPETLARLPDSRLTKHPHSHFTAVLCSLYSTCWCTEDTSKREHWQTTLTSPGCHKWKLQPQPLGPLLKFLHWIHVGLEMSRQGFRPSLMANIHLSHSILLCLFIFFAYWFILALLLLGFDNFGLHFLDTICCNIVYIVLHKQVLQLPTICAFLKTFSIITLPSQLKRVFSSVSSWQQWWWHQLTSKDVTCGPALDQSRSISKLADLFLCSVLKYGLYLTKSTAVWIYLCLFRLYFSITWLNEIPQLLIFWHTSEVLCQQATVKMQTEPDI